MYKLVFGETFKEDVKSSVNYIKQTLQAPIAAERLKNEIKKAYKTIRDTPFIYPIVPNEYLASLGFRFTMVKNYMMFYIVEEKQINIVRFLYGHRDWMNILKDRKLIE
ncbi:type II toxin-antitoxin system RelE/ParE family toxin [Breznakiellaceae bacterium SP9]